MTPAQAAVVLNENVVMHTPVLIKPIVGRALVSIAISISTQSRDDPASTSSKARSTLARPFSDGKAPSKGTISRAWSS